MDWPAYSLSPRTRSVRWGIQLATIWIISKASSGRVRYCLAVACPVCLRSSFPPFPGARCLVWRLQYMDQDGEGPVFVGSEGQGDLQGEDHEVVAEGEEGAFLSGAQGVVVHAGTPDVPPGFTGQGVIDGADQDLCTK